ncbi:MAG: DUF58 domain-containing protein [Lachnoclostridium sp.]|jgi:uncharacterized protein (DUF58 family)|nr:DUF58 domain-containing protein [Lachnoclostridium sp.]
MGLGFLIYFLLTVLCVLISILYIEYSAMQILIILLIFPFCMAVVIAVLRRSISVYVEGKYPVYEMKSLKDTATVILRLKIENKSRFFPLSKGVVYIKYKNIFSGERGKKKLFFSVDTKLHSDREQKITIRHCGGIQISVSKIKIYDYMSMFCCKLRNIKKMETIIVLPPLKEVYIDEDFLFNESNEDSERYSPYKKGDDPTEIFGIRDFKEGDKPQQIHWKLSSKKSALMVKEYSLPLAKEVSLFIDFYVDSTKRHPYRQTDLLIQGIYSYTMALLEMDVPTQLIWYDNSDGTIKTHIVSTEEEFMWVFRELFQSRMTHDDEEFIASYVKWGMGKPMEAGLYLTIGDASKVSGESLEVRHLKIIRIAQKEDADEKP